MLPFSLLKYYFQTTEKLIKKSCTVPNHVLFAISRESSVCVVSDDTDIYILILCIAKHCHGNLYFRQGTHLSKEGIMHHHINPLAAQLSDEICNILPVFHVLTGCDYTNLFYR